MTHGNLSVRIDPSLAGVHRMPFVLLYAVRCEAIKGHTTASGPV